MSSRQHGFVKYKLCEIILMFFSNRIRDAVDRDEMAGIYVDLSKPFTNLQAKEIWFGLI